MLFRPPIVKATRGLSKDLPQFEEGEFGFTTDEKQLFVGSNEGNVEIANKEDLNTLQGEVKAVESQIEAANNRFDEIAEVNANVEVQGARGGFPLLADRLNDVSQQMAQRETLVTTYGADPTGTLDSTLAFQSAVNSLPTKGGVIKVPRGTYLVNTINTGVKSIVFIGEGVGSSIVKRFSTQPVPMYIPLINSFGDGTNDLKIEKLKIDGMGLRSIGIIAENLKSITMVDSEVSNCGTVTTANGTERGSIDGVFCVKVEHGYFTNCTFNNNERDGVLGMPVTHLIVENCKFTGNGRFPSANQQNEAGTIGPKTTKYLNNYVYDCKSGGFDTETTPNLTPCYGLFSGNTIIDCGNDDVGYSWGIMAGINSYGEIVNNFISGLGKLSTNTYYKDGIACTGNKGDLLISGNRVIDSGRHGIFVETAGNSVTVKDNIVKSNNENGVYIYNTPNCIVESNISKNNKQNGIKLNLASNTVVSNNQIKDNSQQTVNTFSGIKSEFSYNSTITNNVISGVSHQYGYHLDSENYVTSLVFDGNQIVDVGTGWFNFSGDTLIGKVTNGKRNFYKASSSPTSGSWRKGDYITNITPTLIGTTPNRYSVKGWLRLTDGANNTWGVDWWEDKVKE
jgi:parallel beta-helix repeat protein